MHTIICRNHPKRTFAKIVVTTWGPENRERENIVKSQKIILDTPLEYIKSVLIKKNEKNETISKFDPRK